MAETAFQIQYRQEFIAGFEQRQSLLRDVCTTEAVIKGNQATFLVADSGSATAQTRGVNGLIQARGDNLTQNTATLVEWHDLVRKTGFNVFASQGSQRDIMQQTSMGVINRKIDSDIIDTLDAGATLSIDAATASLSMTMHAKTILGNNSVPWDNNICMLITPAYEAYMMQVPSFTSRDYISGSPLSNADPAWKDKPVSYHWLGMTWIVHPGLTGGGGLGSATEECYCFHKSAIGHAVNIDGIQALTGYDEEQDYSWARCSVFTGAALLQTTGVVKINHNGLAYASD